MDARSQAIDIVAGLPEAYIASTLEILKNVKQISAMNAFETSAEIVPGLFYKRSASEKIRASVEALAGALPLTDMTLEDFRAERLAKYADIG